MFLVQVKFTVVLYLRSSVGEAIVHSLVSLASGVCVCVCVYAWERVCALKNEALP